MWLNLLREFVWICQALVCQWRLFLGFQLVEQKGSWMQICLTYRKSNDNAENLSIPGGVLPYIDKRHVPRSRVLFFVSVSLDQGLILLFWHTISLPEGWYSQNSKTKFLDSIWLCPRLSFFYCLAMRNTLEYAKRTLISSKLLTLSKLCPIPGYVFGIGLHRGHNTTGSFSNYARGTCWLSAYRVPPPGARSHKIALVIIVG